MATLTKKTYRHQLLVYRMRLYTHYYSTCTCSTTVHISTKPFIFFPLLWSAVEVTAAAATLTFRVKSIETLLRTHSNVFVFFFLFLFFLNMHQSGHSLTLATRPASTEDVKLQLHQMLHSRNDVRARQRSAWILNCLSFRDLPETSFMNEQNPTFNITVSEGCVHFVSSNQVHWGGETFTLWEIVIRTRTFRYFMSFLPVGWWS